MFSKNKIYVLSFSFLVYLICVPSYSGCNQEIQIDQITPANTIFVFNFDTVVVTREITRTAFNSMLAILKHPWVLFLLLKPSFYRDVVHLVTRNIYTDGTNLWGTYHYINHFQKSHTLFTPDVKEALLQVFNAYKPISMTFRTIGALKKSGYQVYIITNKDSIVMERYIKPHLKRCYNIDLGVVFDGCFYDNERKSAQTVYCTIAESLCKNSINQVVFLDNNLYSLGRIKRAHSCFRPVLISSEYTQVCDDIIQQALLWNKKDEKRSVNESVAIL